MPPGFPTRGLCSPWRGRGGREGKTAPSTCVPPGARSAPRTSPPGWLAPQLHVAETLVKLHFTDGGLATLSSFPRSQRSPRPSVKGLQCEPGGQTPEPTLGTTLVLPRHCSLGGSGSHPAPTPHVSVIWGKFTDTAESRFVKLTTLLSAAGCGGETGTEVTSGTGG